MDEKRIEKIVIEVFEKAKAGCVSTSKSAWSNHIAEIITEKFKYISSRTLERAYDRYINKKKKEGSPLAESVELFCKYLGYDSYKNYIQEKVQKKKLNISSNNPIIDDKKKWLIKPLVGIVLIVVCIVLFSFSYDSIFIETDKTIERGCMTWAKNHYEEIACTKKYSVVVEPLDLIKLTNFKKVEVTIAYTFFAENGKPLIWYYKNGKGEIEYFTAPGLHPVNGKTLRKITEGMIKKYVPLHTNKRTSFLD